MKVIKRKIHRAAGQIADSYLSFSIPMRHIEMPGDYHLLGDEGYISGKAEPIPQEDNYYYASTELDLGIGYENLLHF